MKYLSVKEASGKWSVTPRRVQVLCTQNRIEGAFKHAGVWFIPTEAKKPKNLKTGPKKT